MHAPGRIAALRIERWCPAYLTCSVAAPRERGTRIGEQAPGSFSAASGQKNRSSYSSEAVKPAEAGPARRPGAAKPYRAAVSPVCEGRSHRRADSPGPRPVRREAPNPGARWPAGRCLRLVMRATLSCPGTGSVRRYRAGPCPPRCTRRPAPVPDQLAQCSQVALDVQRIPAQQGAP